MTDDSAEDPGGQELFKLLLEGANSSPELMGQDVTKALHHLGAKYDALVARGEGQKVVEVAQQLVWLSMHLLPIDPSAASARVADNMDKLGRALSDVGRHEKAILVRRDVIGHFRNRVEERAEPEFLLRLVGALIEQSQDLVFNEQPERAVSALRQAQHYNAALALHDAAMSARLEGPRLRCLTLALLEMRDHSAALDVGKAAAEHYRGLAASGDVELRNELAGHLLSDPSATPG